jgi:hypothetical protein
MSTLTVACKVSMGLKIFSMDPKDPHREVIINGPAAVAGRRELMTRDGFALTQGVDAEFFDKWLEANKASMLVDKGMIKVFARQEPAKTEEKPKVVEEEPVKSDGKAKPTK